MKIILYDGVCNLCSSIVAYITQKDKKRVFCFVGMQTEKGRKLLSLFGIITEQDSTLLYIRNGVCLKRSTAILYVLYDLGGIWRCFFPLIYLPGFLRNGIYNFISRNRYLFFGNRTPPQKDSSTKHSQHPNS